MTSARLLSCFAFALLLVVGCATQATDTGYVLTKDEKTICDTLHIDTTVIKEIRNFNVNKIEPFHYSLSKIVTKDTTVEADPIYLNGLVFTEANSNSYTTVLLLKDKLKEKGYSIFVLENNFGYNNEPDYIGVLHTVDKFEVLKLVETNGINYDITTDSLVSIIKKFDKQNSLELIGASGDWCEFIIHNEPVSWTQFAQEVYEVCPDVVDQGTETVQALAAEMKRTKRLYFWWD